MKLKNNLAQILKNGIELSSSGTTGLQKKIYQSPFKLKNANKVARECQQITSKSKIYTVCKMEHAGGLLAQTLPAFEVGAEINIEEFNANEIDDAIQYLNERMLLILDEMQPYFLNQYSNPINI